MDTFTLAPRGRKRLAVSACQRRLRSSSGVCQCAHLVALLPGAATLIVKQTDRGDDMFMQVIASSHHHITDHDALSLLD